MFPRLRAQILALAVCLLHGCGAQTTEPMPDIPEVVEYDTVKINYGDDDLLVGGAGLRQNALVGDPSPFAVITKAVVRGTNRTIRDNLQFVRNVTRFPPSSYNDGVWTWEYENADGYIFFAIEETSPNSFRYVFRAGQDSSDSAEVFNGEFTRRDRFFGRQQGFGIIRWNFTNLRRFDPTSPEGEMVIAFRANQENRQVRVGLFGFRELNDDGPADGLYEYVQRGEAGRLKFAALTDWLKDGEPLERTTLDVAWNAQQEGKTKVRLTDGSLEVDEFIIDECWDTSAVTVYTDVTPDVPSFEGGSVDDCAADLTEVELTAPEYEPLTEEPAIPDPLVE